MGSKISLNKRGQVTIFIMLSIILVSIVVLFFFWKWDADFLTIDGPEKYLEDCVINSIKNTEENLLNSNGYLDKDFINYILYNKEKVPYLCVASEFYIGCVPQDPALAERLRIVFENKVARDFEICFNDLKEDWESEGYSVSASSSIINISFNDDYIIANINKDIYASAEGGSVQMRDFEFKYSTSFFSLIKLAQTIVNYESTTCEFNYVNWMRYSPDIFITRARISDQTKVYTIKDRLSLKEIKFAIKTCVLPAGL